MTRSKLYLGQVSQLAQMFLGFRGVGFALLLGLLSSLSLAGCSHAREEATQEMDRLQRAALADLKKGRPQEARKNLLEAVRIGKAADVDAAVMARTHLALGAVYAGPLKAPGKAAAHMNAAIERDPNIKLKGSLATPGAKRALEAARSWANKAPEAADVAGAEKPDPSGAPGSAAVAAAPVAPVPVAPKPSAPEAAPVAPPPVAAAPARPVPVVEEAVPVRGAEPMTCRAPDEAPPENEVMFRCTVRPDVRVTKVMLHYRPAGSELFIEVPMPRNKRGWYIGVAPASATAGKSLQYFVEGRGPTKVHNGTSESPNLILVREGAAPAGPGDPLPGKPDPSEDAQPSRSIDEDPLAAVAQEREAERDRDATHRRRAGTVFVGLGLGSGYGWQPGGSLEFRKDKEVAAGPLSGGLAHLLPEIGYQASDDFAISLQGRFQYIPSEGSGDPNPGSPVEKATAVLVRAVYSFGPTNLRGFFSACAGGGEGFRLRVPRDPQAGLIRNDTVRGGPFLAGAGLGFAYHTSKHLAWTGEARLLAGLPSVAALADFSLGLEVGF